VLYALCGSKGTITRHPWVIPVGARKAARNRRSFADAAPVTQHATFEEVNGDDHARIFRGSAAQWSTHGLSTGGQRETRARQACFAAILLLRVWAAAVVLPDRWRLEVLLCAVLHSPWQLSAWVLPKWLLLTRQRCRGELNVFFTVTFAGTVNDFFWCLQRALLTPAPIGMTTSIRSLRMNFFRRP